MTGIVTEQLLVDIIRREMGLDESRVWIRNQNVKVPQDDGIYISVGFTDGPPMSSQTYMEERIVDGVPVQFEVNRVQTSENIQIDVTSRSNEALIRKWEITAALKSIYSQQIQEFNSFKIFAITRMLNTSIAEGGSLVNRFTTTARCFSRYEKARPMYTDGSIGPGIRNYFENFPARADDQITAGQPFGLFDFELPIDNTLGYGILTESGLFLLTEDGKRLIQEQTTETFRILLENGDYLLSESGYYLDIENGETYLLTAENGEVLVTENSIPISQE